MHWKDTKNLIILDLSRITVNRNIKSFFKSLLFNHSFQLTFWFRIGSFLKNKGGIYKLLYGIVFLIHRHYQFKTGIQLPLGTIVGPGLYFPHFSGIVINGGAHIGSNFTMFHNCTIGSVRGKGGKIIIGDNVVMSTGAIILGAVKIGNNAMIGGGSVVISDVPDNAVVVGVPAKIVNYNGLKNVSYYCNI